MSFFQNQAIRIRSLGAAFILAGFSLNALNAAPMPAEAPVVKEKEDAASFSQEVTMDFSFVGKADTKQGNTTLGEVEEQTAHLRYVAVPSLTDKIFLRLGADITRFSFGNPVGASLPNTLQSTSLILGADFQLNDEWLLRAEIEPGLYSDFEDINENDINAPMILGASYLYNKDLQFFFGISIDLQRNYPVLPGVGLRWKFAKDWTLSLIPPKPRIEWALNKKWTVYAGAEIKNSTFRTAQDFPPAVGGRALNDTPVTYTEARLGSGVSYKINPSLSVEVEGGALVYRNFDFYRANVHYNLKEPAPYVQIGLSGSF